MSLSDVKAVWREHKGVDIADSQRDQWATEGVKFLADNPEEYVAYTRSGNRIVLTLLRPSKNAARLS